jgi:hypothetical protein
VFSNICLYFVDGESTTITRTTGEFEKNEYYEKQSVKMLAKKNNVNFKKIVNQFQNFD